MHSLWLIVLLSSTPSQTATRALTLEDAVLLALESEPAIAAARINRDRSELATLRAQLDRFSFKVDAQLQELWIKSNIGGDREEALDGTLGLSNLSANLTVPLFAGFRVDANVDRAEALQEAAKYDVARQRRDIALAVARAYWAVRKISLLREAQTRAMERLRSAEEIAGARENAGLAPPIDKNRATARRLLQEATLADLDGQLREANAELAVALGIGEEIELIDAPKVPPLAPPAVAELLERARTGRQEIFVAHKRSAAQEQLIRMERSRYYPELSAFTLFQYGNNPFLAGAGTRAVFGSANPFDNMAGDFQIGLVLSVNLFDTLNTRHAVEDAEYERARLGQESRRIERLVEAEVRVARSRVLHFHQLRARLVAARDVAQDNRSIIEKRYQNGEALVFELLDSEIELLDIDRQLTETISELQLAWLELDASLGAVIGERI